MSGLSDSGFEKKTTEAILEEVSLFQTTNISDELDVSPASALGQINTSQGAQDADLWDLAQEAYAAGRIDQAEGQALHELCALTGTFVQPATYSQARATCTLAAGTYLAGTLIWYPPSDPTARFENVSDVIATGGPKSGVVFRAQETGPVRANAGTQTIAETVSGWTAVTTPEDATLGKLIESDTALRIRQAQEITKGGSTAAEAVRVAVAEITVANGYDSNVTTCVVLENDGDTVDGNGQPGHSLQAVVIGGTTQDIVDTIGATKAGGVKAYGTTTGTFTDSQGNAHTIGFSRPSSIDIYLNVQVETDDTYAGDTALKQALADWGDANLSMGSDVVHARLIAVCFSVQGVTDVPLLEIGDTDGTETATNFSIAPLEIADLDTGRIDVL